MFPIVTIALLAWPAAIVGVIEHVRVGTARVASLTLALVVMSAVLVVADVLVLLAPYFPADEPEARTMLLTLLVSELMNSGAACACVAFVPGLVAAAIVARSTWRGRHGH